MGISAVCARSHMKAASDLAQERLTVVEISGSDGSSYRHRGELEVTQSTRACRCGLGDTGADRLGLDWNFRFNSPNSIADRFSPCARDEKLSRHIIFQPVAIHRTDFNVNLESRAGSPVLHDLDHDFLIRAFRSRGLTFH